MNFANPLAINQQKCCDCPALLGQYFEIPIDVDNKLWSDAEKLECCYWGAVVKFGYTGLQKQ